MFNCRRTALSAAVLLTLSAVNTAYAQDTVDCNAQEQAGGMSESAYRALELAIEDMTAERYTEAEERLTKVTDRAEGYERAVVYQTLGFVYAQQEQLSKALEAFEVALATMALPRQAQEDLTYNAGQIYVADEQYEQGIETIERYLAIACKEPPATAHMMLANAHAQLKQYAPALEQVEVALTKEPEPDEQWLQLKLALHYELKDLESCADTLIALIALSTDNANYWKQLSGVLLEIDEQEESLAVLAVAERSGMLETGRDIRNLAGVYLLLEIPYKAGVLYSKGLEDGIVEATADNYEYLSDAWIAAREWDQAEAALRQAAELGDEGDLWKRLAQVQMEKENWTAAVESLGRAIDSGVTDTGQTQYLLGVAAYQAGDSSAAERALRAAVNDPDSRGQAQQWLDHIAANR